MLTRGLLDLVVIHPSKVLDALLQQLLKALRVLVEVAVVGGIHFHLELSFDARKLMTVEWVHVTLPLPVERALAVISLLVEGAAGTDLLVHNGDGLETI